MSSQAIGQGRPTPPVFGAGGRSPYDEALRDPRRRPALHLVESRSARSGIGGSVDVAAFRGVADAVDLGVIGMTTGSVLDLGCGPGRMVEAAVLLGRRALGVDLSAAAVELASRRGVPVLHASVFDTLPEEGRWGAALLLDGNVGIGGDPEALLRRAGELVRPDAAARIVVEAHRLEGEHRFDAVVVDDAGRRSAVFPWAQIGSRALAAAGVRSGLRVVQRRRSGGRRFVVFAPC